MSLTFNNIGKPVVKIKDGKYNEKVISINPDLNDNDATDFTDLKIANESKFQRIPNTTKEREYHRAIGEREIHLHPHVPRGSCSKTAVTKPAGAELSTAMAPRAAGPVVAAVRAASKG